MPIQAHDAKQKQEGGKKSEPLADFSAEAEIESLSHQTIRRTHAAPGALTPRDVIALQRSVGNQTVQRLLARQSGGKSPQPSNSPVRAFPVQRKLQVGPADDKYEREADAIAGQVQRAPTDGPIQRQTAIGPEGGAVSDQLAAKIQRAQNGGSSMSPQVRSALEPKLGADLSNVKIHTGSQSAQLSRDLGAKAFTVRNHIFYGANQSPSDLSLTAHEAVHTVQQGAVPRIARKPAGPKIKTGSSPKPRLVAHAGDAGSRTGGAVIQLKRDTAADKVALNDVRRRIYTALDDGEWPTAIKAYQDINVQYQKSGWWGRTKLGKWSRGVDKLNPDRKKSKALVTDNTKAPDQKLTDIKTIAKSVYGLSRVDDNGNANDIHYMTDMVTKIAYYLVAALPPEVRQLAEKFAGIKPDLGGVLDEDVNRGGNNSGIKSSQVTNDEQAINTALSNGTMSNRGFHGSASWLLEGLGKSGGKLLSQKAAFDAGLLKTGEGTTFSSGASLKTNVYIGKGEMGFGTAASYAMAPAALASYNVSLYSDVELAQTIADYRRIIHLQAVLAEMDPKMARAGSGLLINQILEQAKLKGIDPGVDSGYAHMPKLQTSVQLQDMLSKLQKEVEDRTKWQDDDPRRQGGLLNADNYPILLEFDLGGITATDDFGAQSRVAKGDYRLAGEATVADEVDLTNGRLKVVYVPEQFIAKTRNKLDQVFGVPNTIQVRALESIRGGMVQGSNAEKTLTATYGQLEKQQKSLDVKLRAQKTMSDEMLDYVDKNNKDALHNSITKLMTEGVAPVKTTETPEALLMMGGPGSGKSSIIQTVMDPRELKNMVVADPDAIKNMLPSYQAGVAKGDKDIAAKTHAESKKINSSVVDQTIISRRNLLYDATGANKKEYSDLIQKLKTAGYQIYLVLANLNVEEGVKRVKARAQVTGRSVPENIVRSVYRQVPSNFMSLVSQVHQAYVFDNSGKQPKLVWSTMDGTQLDKQAMDSLQQELQPEEI